MLSRLLLSMALTLAAGTAGCATATSDAAKADEARPDAGGRSLSFETWSSGNGTGGFFRGVGPARGTGVRSAWPE